MFSKTLDSHSREQIARTLATATFGLAGYGFASILIDLFQALS